MLSVLVLGFFHRRWTVNFSIYCFVIFWAGYLVELVGVKTGVIFGTYSYHTALGFKVAGVPPLIGINWLMLIYCSGIISQQATHNIWINTTIGAVLMLLLDLVIEPMAMRFDFWTWQGEAIPLQNFFAWFVVSWGMLFAYHSLDQEKENPVATPLYLIQLGFFAIFWVVDFGFS